MIRGNSARFLRFLLLACLLSAFAALLGGCAGKGAVRPVEERQGSMQGASGEVAVASGDASPFDDDPFAREEDPEISDPIETVNRGTFWLNDKLYTWVFKPTVRVYRFFVHEKIRQSVSNVFTNISEPVYVANSLLQGKVENASRETVRFAVNTTIGVGGLFDVARDYGELPARPEDFGQTLGVWGADHGFYLVLPVLGPSSLRDGVGTVTDYAFTPSTYADLTLLERAGIKTTDYLTEFSLDKDTYEAVVKQSLDPYVTIRNGYSQRRLAAVGK